MAKPRTCPHCLEQIIENLFDQDLNLLCNFCNKIAFPVTASAEYVINSVLTAKEPKYPMNTPYKMPTAFIPTPCGKHPYGTWSEE